MRLLSPADGVSLAMLFSRGASLPLRAIEIRGGREIVSVTRGP